MRRNGMHDGWGELCNASNPPHGAQVMAMTIDRATEFMRLVDNGQISGRISEWPGLREACGAIYAHLTQTAQAVDVEPLRKGFMTAESCGPDGHYLLKVKFQSLDDLQAAHNAITRALAGEKAEGR
jgi:hypothetical protein